MKQIENKIQRNKEKIRKLLNENIDLNYDLFLSRATRVEDTTVNIGNRKNPNNVPAKRMFWDEWFKDEDRPNEKGIKIERSQIIEIDGKKSNNWNVIEYYKIEDL